MQKAAPLFLVLVLAALATYLSLRPHQKPPAGTVDAPPLTATAAESPAAPPPPAVIPTEADPVVEEIVPEPEPELEPESEMNPDPDATDEALEDDPPRPPAATVKGVPVTRKPGR